MRALLVLAAVILLLSLVGWIKFRDSPQRSTITIEKEAIKEDTEGMVERGNEFLEGTRHAIGSDAAAPDAARQPGTTGEAPPPTTEAVPPRTVPDQPAIKPPATNR